MTIQFLIENLSGTVSGRSLRGPHVIFEKKFVFPIIPEIESRKRRKHALGVLERIWPFKQIRKTISVGRKSCVTELKKGIRFWENSVNRRFWLSMFISSFLLLQISVDETHTT